MSVLIALLVTLRTSLRTCAELQLENLALPHQLQVSRAAGRPRWSTTGPAPLDLARPDLARRACPGPARQAGNRDGLAPAWVPGVVDVEEPPTRASTNRDRHPGVDSDHGGRQFAIGRSAHSWRAAQVGDRRQSGHGRQVHAATASTTAVTDVALVLEEPRRADRGRFLRRPSGDLSPAVRAGLARARNPRITAVSHLSYPPCPKPGISSGPRLLFPGACSNRRYFTT
jgi:hypothetical protein